MHPFMALYLWSLSMSRVWQDAVTDPSAFVPNTAPQQQKPTLARNVVQLGIPVGRYLKSDVIHTPLPDFILDKLADLHWVEREPSMAI